MEATEASQTSTPTRADAEASRGDVATTGREIQKKIAGAIGDGEFLPGMPLVEASLAQRYGVSRVPVREALRGLEQDGLVVHVPHKGRFVAALSTQDVEEVFFLRDVLENAAVRLAYERIPDEVLDELQSMLEGLSTDRSPRQDYFAADARIHDVIARYSGNRRLVAMLQLLNSQVERARRTAAMQRDRLTRSRQEHLDLVEALKLRDLPLIEARLRVHLRHVKEATTEVCRTLLRE